MKKIYHSDFLRKNTFAGYGIGLMCFVLFLANAITVQAQTHEPTPSGGLWDDVYTSNTANAGYMDLGSGVIRLLSDINTGQQGAAVHETTAAQRIDPSANIHLDYQVFFGCPGNDNIGSDVNGDGMAFSFWKSSASYTLGNGGGGLGYNGQGGGGNMFTIEFDTYSSAFDAGNGVNGSAYTYGGGLTGINDELSLHIDGNAQASGILFNSNAGNLEDGLEHKVTFDYDATSHVFKVSIDNIVKLTYTYNLSTYFGGGGQILNRSWSSGKEGATNPSTVNHADGQLILPKWTSASFCPASVDITSPINGAVYTGCPVAPITIDATVIPPASNTVTSVEFYETTEAGVSTLICTDNAAPYSCVWASPTFGGHAITAKAYYSASPATSSLVSSIVVGDVLKTGTAPTIDGTEDAIWSSYGYKPITKLVNGAAPTNVADLSAKYKMAYDATNLYVLVDVTDNNLNANAGSIWSFDAVELFFDRGDLNHGSYDGNSYQYGFGWNNAGGSVSPNLGNGGSNGATSGSAIVARQTTKASNLGYIMEMQIPWTRLGFTAGQYPGDGTNTGNMGFDVGVDDNDNGSSRETLYNWSSTSDQNYANPSFLGAVNFSNCNPLPVTWLSFTGTLVSGNVVLNWATATETNNAKFIVERSSNLNDWTSIGEVAGSGNSSTAKKYNFTDYEAPAGISYYRIRQVDVDAVSDVSQTVVIETSGLQTISISPNPFTDAFTIRSSEQGVLNVYIYDVLGRIVYHGSKETTDGILTIRPELSAGTYIITIQTDTFVEQQKIIQN